MRCVEISGSIELVPVVEVGPWRFSERRPPPELGPARLHPDAWHRHFLQCMEDAGFPGTQPIAAGSHFVAASALPATLLFPRLLTDGLEGLPGFPDDTGREDLDPVDVVGPLDGGYALMEGSRLLLSPQCCGDLADIAEWTGALRERPEHGELWIGHPQLEVAFAGDRVTLRETWDYGPPPEYLLEVTLPVDELERAVAQAAKEREVFEAQIEAELERLPSVADLAGLLAPLLAGRPH